MAAKFYLIAWSKAILHAIVIPALLLANMAMPFGLFCAVLWLLFATVLYTGPLAKRPAAKPFLGITLVLVFFTPAALIGMGV